VGYQNFTPRLAEQPSPSQIRYRIVKEIDNSPPPPDWKRTEEDNPNLIPLVTTRGRRRDIDDVS
jgi:hypothetical protein